MNTTELRKRLVDSDREGSDTQRSRRADRTIARLRWIAEEMTDRASRARRAGSATWNRDLRRLDAAALSPVGDAVLLADLGIALRLQSDDRAALTRLVVHLNRHKGRRAEATELRFGSLVDEAQAILRKREERAPAQVSLSWPDAVLARAANQEAA